MGREIEKVAKIFKENVGMEPYANSSRDRKRRGRERERNHEREKKTIAKKEERFNGEDKTED